MKNLNLFLRTALLLLLFFTGITSAASQTDDFGDGTTQGWTGTGVVNAFNVYLQFTKGSTGTKTYQFGSEFANHTVKVTFFSYYHAKGFAEGVNYGNFNGTGVTHTFTTNITEITDSNGEITLSFQQLGNSDFYIREITVETMTAVAGIPPIMGDVPDQTIVKGLVFSLDISEYATRTHNDITDYNLTCLPNLPVGLNFNTSTGLLDGTPTALGSYNCSATATDEDNTSEADAFIIDVIPPQADLQIIKSGPATVDATTSLSYTLTINSNATEGMTDAQNIIVTDTLPVGMTYSGYDAPSGWTCTLSGETVSCNIATLSPGYSGTITLDGYAPEEAGTIVNRSAITSDTHDPDNSNNESEVNTDVIGTLTDLSITKTANPNPVIAASQLDYTIIVKNRGIDDASDVQVIDNLDSDLHFISVDGGSDWSCSQGQLIICDYIGTGGILVSGASATAITISVTAPTSIGEVPNIATVSSDIEDANLSNNESNVTVLVEEGTSTGTGRPLSKYLQYNIFGDMKLVGNTNINYTGANHRPYNDEVNMEFIDTDSDGSTFNSSSSTLSIPDETEIIWAGLYWEGHLCEGHATGCRYNNMPYDNLSQAIANIGTIKFKTPDHADYMDITANNVDIISGYNDDGVNRRTYSAFADITNLIDTKEAGVYTAANIILTEGLISNGGNYGGWSMLIIYNDPDKKLHYKNISVFNGFQYMKSNGNPVEIDGFVTPVTGSVKASLAFFAADGDPAVGGVARMRVGKSSTYNAIGGDAANPTNNLFNSTISEFGVPINAGITKTYGVDADRIDVSNFMDNNQQDTKFFFDVNAGNNVDWYSLSMFTFATDLTSPIIDNFDKNASIIDTNGTVRQAAPGEPIYPESELLYTLTFKNTGDERADDFEVFDDFDFDGLTPALDLRNFDASKIKLSEPNSDTWQTNPKCKWNSGHNKVSCKIKEVNVGDEYKMQFSVKVKKDLVDLEDENATNTAYANYKNATTDEYVVLRSNEHGNFGGASNTFDAGIFTLIGDDEYIRVGVDAINEGYPYNDDKNITTKIVNSAFDLKLVYLDATGNPASYVSTDDYTMPVLLTLESNSSVRVVPDEVTLPQFANDNQEITATGLNIARAYQNIKINMGFIDWSQVMSWSSDECDDKSTTSNYKGLPACLDSTKIGSLFQAYPYVHITCLGSTTAACNSPTNFNSNIPKQYRHAYGCYQCLTDANATLFQSTSTDNFSTRPDKFILSSSSTHYPDLLRSGADYNMTLQAVDGQGGSTLGYDRSESDLTDLNDSTSLYFNDGAKYSDTSTDIMYGDRKFGAAGFSIVDGISLDTTATTSPNEVAGITFDDVGIIGLRVKDENWTNVDHDDTPLECNVTKQTIQGIEYDIEGSAFICSDEYNVTFIPDHFTLSSVQLTNHNKGNYTYLSNNLAMSAHIGTKIIAENKQNQTTKNFQDRNIYYENPVDIDMNVTEWNTTVVAIDLNGSNTRHPENNQTKIKDINTTSKLGFGKGTDTAGIHTIPWNEGNASQQLKFNYERDSNNEVDAFRVPGSDVNLTATSIYISQRGAPEGTATIVGSALATGNNALFVYARARASKDVYPDIIAIQVNTPIAIDIYNSNIATPPFIPPASINTTSIPDWFLALDHNTSLVDVNAYGVVQLTQAGARIADWNINGNNPIIITDGSAVDNTVFIRRNNPTALPLTATVDLCTLTSSWLRYDDKCTYDNIFIRASNWGGVGNTGNVLNTAPNTTKTRRLSW